MPCHSYQKVKGKYAAGKRMHCGGVTHKCPICTNLSTKMTDQGIFTRWPSSRFLSGLFRADICFPHLFENFVKNVEDLIFFWKCSGIFCKICSAFFWFSSAPACNCLSVCLSELQLRNYLEKLALPCQHCWLPFFIILTLYMNSS